jgi:hypothetical protein
MVCTLRKNCVEPKFFIFLHRCVSCIFLSDTCNRYQVFQFICRMDQRKLFNFFSVATFCELRATDTCVSIAHYVQLSVNSVNRYQLHIFIKLMQICFTCIFLSDTCNRLRDLHFTYRMYQLKL